MSDIRETDTTESSGTEKFKSEMPPSLWEKLQDIPEAVEYIKTLERYVKKQKKKLRKMKAKLKRIFDSKDACVQTELTESVSVVKREAKPKSIAEEITEAAELATHNAGFVYDEASGMYYDSNTGYYYNAEYGLYYEASTGTYLSYKQDTNTYEFHSQVYVQNNSTTTKETAKRKKKSKDELQAAKSPRMGVAAAEFSSHETEEGECSITSEEGWSCDETESDTSADVSKQWPPCMRIIIEQSHHPKIKVGSLHLLTYEGGTLGREGNHSIVLPDINISKCHLRFTFNKEKNVYLVMDVGSRNGTVLNGKRMSISKRESESLEVAHGSRIQVGSVVLLCHIHEGSRTCGLCEPGLLQVAEKKEQPMYKVSMNDQHKVELRKLKKKFGVSSFDESNSKLASGYTDRAQKRRDMVGSQNPHEKTEVASVNESISSRNKGFKMLAKMGWKEGQCLGKGSEGRLEPVQLVSNPGTSGMGSEEAVDRQFDKNKQIIWKKTQERYNQLPKLEVFEDSD